MPRLSTPVDPRPLAVARIGIGAVALLNLVHTYGTLLDVADGRIALPVHETLPDVSAGLATAYVGVGALAGTAVLLGLATRPAAVALAGWTWLGFAWEQQTYSNHLMLGAWLALWLAFGRSDAAWSLRARLHGRSRTALGDQVLLMTQLSACYLFAAVAKLNPGFLSGDELRSYVDVALPEPAYSVLAIATVAVELCLALGLWWRRARCVIATAGVLLHLTIPVAMWSNAYGLIAFSLLCLALFPLFLFQRASPEGRRLVTNDNDPAPRHVVGDQTARVTSM